MLEESPSPREGYANYTFTISDTGIGMSEDFQKMVFEPFARESTSTVSKIQGTGLGMSIVRDLVELMDGEISIDSKQGRGTTVRICVPLRLAEPEAHSDAVGESAVWDTSGLAGKRVLLVEDNEMNREIASYILSENGLVVEHADDGDVAVEMVRAAFERGEPRYYDAVLMDIQMPVMNGYEAAKAIRALAGDYFRDLPIIAVSANAYDEDVRDCLDAGMDAHIAKPFNPEDLLNQLNKMIRRQFNDRIPKAYEK
jgi:CheY-like chemotaxis protein